jgi:hypothetical protein
LRPKTPIAISVCSRRHGVTILKTSLLSSV